MIGWTTTIQKQMVWKDRDNNIFDETYTKITVFRVFGIPLFKNKYDFHAKHELNEFEKSSSVKGFSGGKKG